MVAIMLMPYITPVEIGLSIGFLFTLIGSLWFCLRNYSPESLQSEQSLEGME